MSPQLNTTTQEHDLVAISWIYSWLLLLVVHSQNNTRLCVEANMDIFIDLLQKAY